MLLKGKIALITGSNRGVGLSILKKFSENGAEIIACARNKSEEFEKVIFDISKQYDSKQMILQASGNIALIHNIRGEYEHSLKI